MTTYIKNKKAHFNYQLLDTYEAGAVLFGYEVKSIRASRGKLDAAHVVIRGGEAFLVGAQIPPYQPVNAPKDYDPERSRKLLLSKKELAILSRESDEKGLTIIPISWYNKGSKLKLSIALGKGKKKADKRETLKARDNKRAIDRIMKSQ